jgi:hypothetical protein
MTEYKTQTIEHLGLVSSMIDEQGYKELRQHFGFGQEENRIYEALIARITLSFFTYNIVSYIMACLRI